MKQFDDTNLMKIRVVDHDYFKKDHYEQIMFLIIQYKIAYRPAYADQTEVEKLASSVDQIRSVD